ncbi:hypothetical protein [Acidithiobacillus marinus]|uniref:hypothetical protein n=1 Tax=Acidithiobacillus marinus TaxID=187490 RepID=UPI001C0ECB5F|nr:hypothetical protein [Acidithiobacillus marinus]
MKTHNTVVSGFITLKDANVEAALFEARHEIGESAWKQGYSEEKCKATRAIFKKHGAGFVTKLSGPLMGFSTKENVDGSGNTYQKARIVLGKDIISLEVDTEFCQRLLPKLETVIADMGLGTEIVISAFPTEEERNGRKFINHTASVKVQGTEVKGASHFKKAQEAAKAAGEAMKSAGIKDAKALKAARQSAKNQYFWELAEKLGRICADQHDPEPSPLFIKALDRIQKADISRLDAAQEWVSAHFFGEELVLLTEAIQNRCSIAA